MRGRDVCVIMCNIKYRWEPSGGSDGIMECVDGLTITFYTTSSGTNRSMFNSSWSCRGHINSIIRLMAEWQNKHKETSGHTVHMSLQTQAGTQRHDNTYFHTLIRSYFVQKYTHWIHTHSGKMWDKCLSDKSWSCWFVLSPLPVWFLLIRKFSRNWESDPDFTRCTLYNTTSINAIRIIWKMLWWKCWSAARAAHVIRYANTGRRASFTLMHLYVYWELRAHLNSLSERARNHAGCFTKTARNKQAVIMLFRFKWGPGQKVFFYLWQM